MWCKTLIFLVFFLSLYNGDLSATPFPVKGEIYNGQDELIARAHVYPRYVEIMSLENQMIGKVGVLVHEGIGKLFLVENNENRSIVGVAARGKVFDQNDKLVGTYVWTPTWSFIYNIKGKRAGKVKCIAWPRVCAAGVGGYLLNLFGGQNGTSP